MDTVLGTAFVAAILIPVVVLIIMQMVKDKRAGKSSCGCKCAGCANAGMCHANAKKIKKIEKQIKKKKKMQAKAQRG